MLQHFKTLSLAKTARFLGVVLAAVLISVNAYAQFAATPCDPQYMESLKSRAWLEAQREVTQNQNLIYKPDSVLEYTCFVGHLNVLAQEAQNMFSELQSRWTPPPIPVGHMQSSLQSLVGTALQSYAANFDHTLLGGRYTRAYAYLTSGITVSPGAYSCDLMQDVWREAKCKNFIDRPSHDGFFTLQEYIDDPEKRQLPTACPKPSQWSNTTRDQAIPPVGATTPWDFDEVVTYYDRLFPTSGCGTSTNNRVRTGLIVRQAKSTPEYFNEYACIVPGCNWVPTGSGTAASPSNSGNCTP